MKTGKIIIFEATMGGIVGRKYTYSLIFSSDGTRTKVIFGKNNCKFFKQSLFDNVVNLLLPLLKIRKETNNNNTYGTPELIVDIDINSKHYNWENTGPDGCVHMGPSFRPSQKDIELYHSAVNKIISLSQNLT